MNAALCHLCEPKTLLHWFHALLKEVNVELLKLRTISRDTSKVPPPRSKTKTFRSSTRLALLSRPYARAAAVGTVTTAFFTGDSKYDSATSRIFERIMDDISSGESLVLNSFSNQSLIICEGNKRRSNPVAMTMMIKNEF
ncbi:hypothetical protein Lal_00036799 [Lupinus albus]|nr:hypothetical protein Lal_00036799 [Lupinus albus]